MVGLVLAWHSQKPACTTTLNKLLQQLLCWGMQNVPAPTAGAPNHYHHPPVGRPVRAVMSLYSRELVTPVSGQ